MDGPQMDAHVGGRGGRWGADMRRDNKLTAHRFRVLRFPVFAVRDQPEIVAAQIAAALRLGGDAC
jgi:very-short-patch-repair endonuclease